MLMVLDKPIAWPLNWTAPYALRGLGASGPLTPGQQSAEGTVSVVAGAVGTGVALAAAIPGVVTTALVLPDRSIRRADYRGGNRGGNAHYRADHRKLWLRADVH